MFTVFVVFMSIVNVDKVIDDGLQAAREGSGRVQYIFALDQELPATLDSVMDHIGFLGDQVMKDVKKAISDHYKLRVDEIQEKVILAANAMDVEVSFSMLEQDIFRVGRELFAGYDADLFIVNLNKNYDPDWFKMFDEENVEVLVYVDGEKRFS